MPSRTPAVPELLAPAGSLEAFFAAMDHGADAVYCGLREYSARAKARNFTLHDLERAVNYAHHHGRRVFVTLNTLVKERELPGLVEALGSLEAIGVDAVILQDLAVWRLARRHFPGLRLHASTQLTIHNAAGVRMLEAMGFSRVVLARELSLEEIAAIRRETRMELEQFVHGALCFSFSGQCTFSSWMGGKSGNRGRCAQPCRRLYRQREKSGYYFSTSDLSAIDLLPALSEAGVGSLKIEGRMKSAEYVAQVVSAYRQVLDAPEPSRTEAVREAKKRLRASFGRPPTKGFLPGGVPTDIAIPSMHGATGLLLGEVTGVRDAWLRFRTREDVHVGDRLRVQPGSDRAGAAFTVKELRLGKKPVKRVRSGGVVETRVPFPERLTPGDRVFKVSSDRAYTASEASCRRRLESVPVAGQPVRVEVAMPAGDRLLVKAEAGPVRLEREFEVETFPAREAPLNAEVLREVFARTAREPLELASLKAGPLPPVVIPPSRLKAIRREFYGELSRELGRSRRAHVAGAAAELFSPSPDPGRREAQITARIAHLRELHLLEDPAVDRVLVPLEGDPLPELARLERRRERIVWDLPLVLLGEEWKRARERVRLLVGRGHRRFRLNNLGHFPLFEGLEGLHLETGFPLFTFNSQAAAAWGELGAEAVVLHPEDDRENLGELLARRAGPEPEITIFGPVPLLISRIPVRGLRAGEPLTSDGGERFRVRQRRGVTLLTPEQDFSLLGRLHELRELGCLRFTLDLSHIGAFSAAGKRALEALRQDASLPGTSPFNYLRGVE